MPRSLSAAEVPGLLRPGLRVYAPGLAGESGLIVDALRSRPDASAGVRYIGVWLPGINRVDYAGLHPDARSTAFFIYPDLRPSFDAGRIDFLPLSYFSVYAYLRDRAAVDLALLHVSPPGDDGRCSVGVANDFTPAILPKARIKVAHVNPRMPRTRGAATVAFEDLDYVIEGAHPLLSDDPASDPDFDAIGRHIADVVPDGATLEVGVGRVQSVFAALTGKRDLALHTGAITTPVLRLVEAGAIAARDGAITTGVALGDDALYRFVADNCRVRFAPVGWTHDIATLRAIDRFVAINSVIEVDLLGQANAEILGGRQVSSAGGITDFMRGARLSAGGFAIVALPSTARSGTLSRIVPELADGAAVSVARGDMDLVVTENGVADLRDRTIDERAEALISVAAPRFRDALTAAWRERRAKVCSDCDASSIALGAELAKQILDARVFRIVAGAGKIVLQGGNRRAHLPLLKLKNRAFPPQLRALRREQRHDMEDIDGALDIAVAHRPQLDVVLQADQDVAIAHGRVMRGAHFGAGAMQVLEPPAQIPRTHDPSSVKRVEDRPLCARFEAQQEVRGKIQSDDVGTASPGGMEIQNAESHRQALAPVDHMHQVRVVHVFVCFGVALVTEFHREDLAQRRNLHADTGSRIDRRVRLVGQLGQVIAVGGRVDAGPVESRQDQGGIGQVDVGVVPCSDFAQRFHELRPL